VKNCSILYLFVRRCSAGQTGLSLRRRRSGGLTLGLQGPVTLAPPGFCNRGGSEVWVHRGSRVRSPPVPVVLSVYQRGSLLDALAMYLSCETKKFHDNESTHILHNFWTSTHRGGEASPLPPWRRHCPVIYCSGKQRRRSLLVLKADAVALLTNVGPEGAEESA